MRGPSRYASTGRLGLGREERTARAAAVAALHDEEPAVYVGDRPVVLAGALRIRALFHISDSRTTRDPPLWTRVLLTG